MRTGTAQLFRRRSAAVATALLLPLAAIVGLATQASAAASATATYAKSSDWGTGFGAGWTIKNTGTTTITSWTVEWDYPTGTSVTSFWDATVTHTANHWTAKNVGWNGTLAPGASASFGFNGAGSGSPSGCKVNGGSCDGGTVPPGDNPPSAPGAPTASGITNTSATLSWTAATDDKGVKNYDVIRDGNTVATVTGLTYTNTGLTAGTDYVYTVKARDTIDQTGPASNAAIVHTTGGGGGDPGGTYAKVGYFVQWGIYGRGYTVKSLVSTGAAAKLTHINYAFSNIDPANLTCMNGVTKATTSNPEDPNQGDGAGDSWADYEKGFSAGESVNGSTDTWDQPLAGNFNQIKQLKAKYPNLKVNISIGGWTYSKYFSDAAKTAASRQKFVQSCIDMYLKGNLPVSNGRGGPGSAAGVFDGVDIDWEWPGSPDGHPGNHYSTADKANLTALLAEFRTQMNALTTTTGKKYLLTAFTPADPAKVDLGWDISANGIFKSMDFANVQGYDFHGSGSDNSWEPLRTGHQANLYPDTQDPYTTHFSVEGAVNKYLGAGVSPRQLTIGLAFYGRGWQQVTDGGAHGEWQAANGAAPGQFPEESGTRGYSNLIASVGGLTVYHDEQSVATYGYTGANGQWWSFDDTWSIGKKSAWIKSKNLLGAMIWEMSGDTGTLMTSVDSGLK
ncbi:glycoside hydrolase family 18 chitinase [Streptomyces sp. RKAG293]|uniref:glycoside hydrolase family 18 chitinase n=1 Tax=Streptomyces sp. RKAG293 TaxID=2893403 RepID=UPI00203440BB|nr:glycoside hydrolase family 18 chitinase [Streptomyces sp. RKAG293]MCM2421681.1 glycoside hydrolase family 18 chitinase [Streptomyces sp. RKAG293]